jgi:hypothetical protein
MRIFEVFTKAFNIIWDMTAPGTRIFRQNGGYAKDNRYRKGDQVVLLEPYSPFGDEDFNKWLKKVFHPENLTMVTYNCYIYTDSKHGDIVNVALQPPLAEAVIYFNIPVSSISPL